jgi:rare lipoprotein A
MPTNKTLQKLQDFLRSRNLGPEGGHQRIREFHAEWVGPAVLLIFLVLTACGPKHRIVYERRMAPPEKQEVKKETVQEEKPSIQRIEKRETQQVQYGVASWYGPDFHGKPTSSGEIYDMYQLTCAHNTFALGTTVMVTNLENGRSIELKVNDRGPFVKERIIDLSYAAAQMLGMWEKGTAYVKVEGFGPLVEEIQRFTVQVGSFGDEANAQKLADQLRRGFENVYVSTVETLTQKYHRVRVGQFETKELALTIAEKLSQLGFRVLVTSR